MGCIIAISIAPPLAPEFSKYILRAAGQYIEYLLISPAVGAQIYSVRACVGNIPECTGNSSLTGGTVAIIGSIPIPHLEIKGESRVLVDRIVIHRNAEEIRPSLRPAASVIIAPLDPMGRTVERREIISILSVHVIVAVFVYHHVGGILRAGLDVDLSSMLIVGSSGNGRGPGNCGLIGGKPPIIEEIISPP